MADDLSHEDDIEITLPVGEPIYVRKGTPDDVIDRIAKSEIQRRAAAAAGQAVPDQPVPVMRNPGAQLRDDITAIPGEIAGFVNRTGTALYKGVSNFLGFPGSAIQSANEAGPWVDPETGQKLNIRTGYPPAETPALLRKAEAALGPAVKAGVEALPTVTGVRDFMQNVMGIPFEEPTTSLGRVYTQGVETFTPFGGPFARGLSAASGAAGQTAREMGLPEQMATAIMFATPIVGGLGGALKDLTRPRAEKMIVDILRSDKVTDDELRAANAMVAAENGQRSRPGRIPVTLGRALAEVTNGRASRMLFLEMLVENSGSAGGGMMRDLNTQIESAIGGRVKAQARELSPGVTESGSPIASQMRDAASSAMGEARTNAFARAAGNFAASSGTDINRLYVAHVVQQLENAIMSDVGHPQVAQQLVNFRNALVLAPAIPPGWRRTPGGGRVWSDGAPPVYMTDIGRLNNLIQAWREQLAPKVLVTGVTSADPAIMKQANHFLGPWLGRLEDIMEMTDPRFERGRAQFGLAAETTMEPLERQPVGQLARKPDQPLTTPTLAEQHRMFFGGDATPEEVASSVRLMQRHNPNAVARFVGQRLEDKFDALSAQDTWRSASFLASFSSREGQLVEAYIRALPNGERRWNGWRTLMARLSANARRMGSGTGGDFGGTQREMGRGRIPLPFRAFTKTQVWVDDMIRGANNTQLARMVTDPRYGRRIEALVNAPQQRRGALADAVIADWVKYEADKYIAGNQQTVEGFLGGAQSPEAAADARARAEGRIQ